LGGGKRDPKKEGKNELNRLLGKKTKWNEKERKGRGPF